MRTTQKMGHGEGMRLHKVKAKRQREVRTTTAAATTTTTTRRTRAAATTTTATTRAPRTTSATAREPRTVTILYATNLPPALLPGGSISGSANPRIVGGDALPSERILAVDPSSAIPLSLSSALQHSGSALVASTTGLTLVAAGQANAAARNHLSLGAVVGIVAGGVAIIVGVLAGLSFCMIRARRRKVEEKGWWAAGVGPIAGAGKEDGKKGESRQSLIERSADSESRWNNEKTKHSTLPPLPPPVQRRSDQRQQQQSMAPDRSLSFTKRLQGSLKRLGSKGGEGRRANGEEQSGRVSPFEMGKGDRLEEPPKRPYRASDELFLALALPDPSPSNSPELEQRPSISRKKDTIMVRSLCVCLLLRS